MLILSINENLVLSIGSIGYHYFSRGFYAYVGSAKGPGGLKARIRRHLRKIKKTRWHIDYLTVNNNVSIVTVIYAETHSMEDYESLIASELYRQLKPYIKGFGSSDKDDYTHLFKCSSLRECIEISVKAMEKHGLKPRVSSLR